MTSRFRENTRTAFNHIRTTIVAAIGVWITTKSVNERLLAASDIFDRNVVRWRPYDEVVRVVGDD